MEQEDADEKELEAVGEALMKLERLSARSGRG